MTDGIDGNVYLNDCIRLLQDDEIKSYVKEILDQANLEEITMKVVCKQVYAKFPQFDLSDKKDFIKTTVKSVSIPTTLQIHVS